MSTARTEALSTLGIAALHLAELGYPVFRLVPRTKKPTKGSNGLLDATTDPEVIEAWWREMPEANIGVATEGLLILDPDLIDKLTANPKPNPWLTEERARELAAAPLQMTWSGGRQYFYRQPAGKAWRNTDSDIAQNVDTRAGGGYIVIAPSFVRDAGKSGRYRFVEGCELVARDLLPEPPARLAAELDRIEANRGKPATPKHETNGESNGKIPTGKRNAALASLAGTMRRRGMAPDAIEAALQVENRSKCDPPLTDNEVKAIAASVARYKPSDPVAADANERPAPEPFRPFPVDALPEPVGGYVTAAAAAIGCDSAYAALPMLAMLAACIGTTRRVQLKRDWCEPAVLWAAIVGESGTQKSPAIDAATKPAQVWQTKAIEHWREAWQQYERDLLLHDADMAEWKRNGRKKGEPAPTKPDEPICERLLVSDVTVEALADRLSTAPRGLLLCRDELSGWLGGFDQYRAKGKGSDVSHWLSMYGARPMTIDRKTGEADNSRCTGRCERYGWNPTPRLEACNRRWRPP